MKIGNLYILGDSFSTFRGAIPEGHAYWYSNNPKNDNDVCAIEHTWWNKLISATDSKLVLNDSYSGTTICNTGYNGEDCSDKSFIARMDKKIAEGFFVKNKLDTIMIFGGTNDHCAKSPLGELEYLDFDEDNLKEVLPAFCYMLMRLKWNSYDTRIIAIISEALGEEMKEGFKTACEEFDVEYILLDNISKSSNHPNIEGMQSIYEQVLAYLESKT